MQVADYTQMMRPQLLDICIERGFSGLSHKTKRELVGLLQSADREIADLRQLRRRRRAAAAAAEERQMKAADADCRSATAASPLQHPKFKTHILNAIMHGFPQYPVLTAVLSALRKIEEAPETQRAADKPIQYYIEEHELFPARPTSPKAKSHAKNALHKPQDD